MSEEPNTNPEPKNEETGSVSKKPNVGLIVGLIVAVLVIIGLVVFIVVQQNEDSDSSSSSKSKKDKNTTNTVAEKVVDDEEDEEDEEEDTSKDKKSTKKDKKKAYGLGDTFEFGDFEVKVGDKYTTAKVDNQYADTNGKDVIMIPVTVTNNSDETKSFSTFYLNYFGSKGTEITTSVDYYMDNSLAEMGSLRSGASNTANICILYDGDGTYAVEFDDWDNKVTLEFDVEL